MFGLFLFSSESEEEAPPPKKEYHFKNKKEAIEAFKTLLKEKVRIFLDLQCMMFQHNFIVDRNSQYARCRKMMTIKI